MTAAEGTRLVTNRPVFGLKPDVRRATALRFVGRRVRLTYTVTRNVDDDEALVYYGEVVTVARPAMGTVADLIILRRSDGDWAWSLASVLKLEEVTEGEERAELGRIAARAQAAEERQRVTGTPTG